MQTRFLLSDGRSVYAPYLESTERIALKKELEDGIVKMYCGCNKDTPLYYGVSSDLRIIPLHKHYEHKNWCSRFDSENRSSAAIYSDDGTITLYVSFKPHTFTMSSAKEKPEEDSAANGTEGGTEDSPAEEKEEQKKEKSLPSYNLYNMIRFLNHDTYMNRVASGKYPYLSEEYFLNAFHGHLKNVRLDGMRKSLKELSLKEDKMKFFYVKIEELEEKSITYPGYDGKKVRRFVPLNVMAKAEEAFEKKYGISVKEYQSKGVVMAAGFQYERLNHLGSAYKCVGRMVFFPVTEYNLYVDSLLEQKIIDVLMKVCKKHNCLFLYSEEDKGSIVGIIRNNATGKEAPIFYNRKASGFKGDYFSCRGEVPCVEELEAFLPALT